MEWILDSFPFVFEEQCLLILLVYHASTVVDFSSILACPSGTAILAGAFTAGI